ncbi:MAG: NADH-quinone oxidoreductase subunit NuoG [Dokdonella sp.]|uniref:NADH-quinone oxidoreductase subunit NuoG n=1 Tax=Dokdonella sp. TaxID=2291710 RepID=UPI0032658A5C
MSAQPVAPSVPPDHVTIEIDGQSLVVPKNSMIIQAADKAGIAIPRFCYHEKLPIAANCRMCMVEVEMGGRPMPKPQPACATPVADGMKIQTQSQRALSAQRNVMEFLLINHPLDCPICDQGGECELQDLSMGYGRSVSRFVEKKRVVPDEDLGPLVETEMTRCIQCTRCVRVMADVAGTYELGGMERGEMLQIGTHVGKPLMSELSGNVIDVCPVGALTNKPFRFKARPWELIARESIGYHDALGSNLWLHTRRGEALRAVPRDNEAINECWLSDRDRYSNDALRAPDRALKPMIRKDGVLVETTWADALAFVADRLRAAAGDIGALVAPLTSSEEGHLLGTLLRGLGSDSIDHRLRLLDTSDAPGALAFEMQVAELEKANAILLIGCNPRHEVPLLNHRIRNAVKGGAKVYAINPLDFDFNFELVGKKIVAPSAFVSAVLSLAERAGDTGEDVDDATRSWIRTLADAGASVVIIGETAVLHPHAARIRAAAKTIAKATGSAYNEIPAGANALGLRHVGAEPRAGGKDAVAMLASSPKHLIIYHAGSQDTSAPAAFDRARTNADFCVYIGGYACAGVLRTAHAVLPIGLPPEIDGSYTNLEGTVQTLAAATKLPGDARPGWKVLRALGSALSLSGFEFTEIAEVRAAIGETAAVQSGEDPPVDPMGRLPFEFADSRPASLRPDAPALDDNGVPLSAPSTFTRISTVGIYSADAVLRRSPALRAHPLSRSACVTVHPEDALALGVGHGANVTVSGVVLPVAISMRVPRGGAWIESGHSVTSALPAYGSALDITKA